MGLSLVVSTEWIEELTQLFINLLVFIFVFVVIYRAMRPILK